MVSLLTFGHFHPHMQQICDKIEIMDNEYNTKIASTKAFSKLNVAILGRKISQLWSHYQLCELVDAGLRYLQKTLCVCRPPIDDQRTAKLSCTS